MGWPESGELRHWRILWGWWWLESTTVEDMDIAVRAHLNGWKFIFLNDVECHYKLPESYDAYRKQQHRWHSGPMQLFRPCLPDIIKSKMFRFMASDRKMKLKAVLTSHFASEIH